MKEPLNTTNQDEKLSKAQFNSVWKWCGDVAEILRKEGKSMYVVLERMKRNDFLVESMPTKNSIKELVWKSFQQAIIGTESFKDLKKRQDIDLIIEPIIKFFAEDGIILPNFPSEEEKQIKSGLYDNY